MTRLFHTNISFNNEPVDYAVFFNDEEYHFQSSKEELAISFSLKREHEEWRTTENINEELKNNAIIILEKYLLSQH
jgi:hypothetical protein